MDQKENWSWFQKGPDDNFRENASYKEASNRGKQPASPTIDVPIPVNKIDFRKGAELGPLSTLLPRMIDANRRSSEQKSVKSGPKSVDRGSPKVSTAIYDSQIHQYNNESDKISLRKRKPIRSIDVSDLESLHAHIAEESGSNQLGKKSTDGSDNKLKNKLLVIMMTLFSGQDLVVEQIEALTKEEKHILCSLALRKFGIKFQPSMNNSNILKAINEQRHFSKPKRLEENYKLVFKKALKYLIKKFKKSNDVRGKKSDLELQFYKFYFEEAFKKEGLEEEMGTVQTSKGFKGQTLFNPKTINSRYITNIMKSDVFKTHFEDFLEHYFILDYSKSREFKIQKVVEKCYECFSKKRGGGFEEVQKYIEQNPKCKLQWSDQELIAARESVKQLLWNKLKKPEATENKT